MEHLNMSTSPLFDISYDVFYLILQHLSKLDLLHLMQTCRGLKTSLVVQQATFTELFSKEDRPYESGTAWLFHSLIHRLDTTNAYLVQSMVMHKDADGEHLEILQRLCINLYRVDFRMVSDTIDDTSSHCWTVAEGRRMGCTNKCVLVHHDHGKFCFRRMITLHPGFFHRLKSISLRYTAYLPYSFRHDDELPEDQVDDSNDRFHDEFSKDNSDSNQDWLIKLLDVCPDLDCLELYKTPQASSYGQEWRHPYVFVKLAECLSHVPKLNHLKLYNMDKVVRNQFLFLQSLSQNVKHVTITLNLNLSSYGKCYENNQSSIPLTHREAEIYRATLRTGDDYLFALNEAIRQRKRIFHLSDDESDWPVQALRDVTSSQLLFDPANAFWLKEELDWKPILDWSGMVHLETESQSQVPGLKLFNDQLAACRGFYLEIKNQGIPILLRLNGSRYEGTLFAAADPKEGEATPRQSATISDWYLETIGDLVDELQLFWGLFYPVGNRHKLVTEEDDLNIYGPARDASDDYPSPDYEAQTRKYNSIMEQRLTERCDLETELVSQLFNRFSTVFPNVTTVKLRVPSDLYPAVVQRSHPVNTNIDTWYASVLPGNSGWTITREKDKHGWRVMEDTGDMERMAKSERKLLNRTFTRNVELF